MSEEASLSENEVRMILFEQLAKGMIKHNSEPDEIVVSNKEGYYLSKDFCEIFNIILKKKEMDIYLQQRLEKLADSIFIDFPEKEATIVYEEIIVTWYKMNLRVKEEIKTYLEMIPEKVVKNSSLKVVPLQIKEEFTEFVRLFCKMMNEAFEEIIVDNLRG